MPNQESKQEEVLRLAGLLIDAYGRKASEAQLWAYWIATRDLPLERIQAAIESAILSCEHLPVPAVIRRMSGVANPEDRAVYAWEAVQQAIPVGPYKHVEFDDPAINATIRQLGGWPSFLSRLESAEGEKWARHEFVRAYAVLYNSGVGEAGKPLPGLAEATVDRHGRLVPPAPVRIKTGLHLPHRSRAQVTQQGNPQRQGILKTA